jgi:NADH-quinone oxidoreductase subunit J
MAVIAVISGILMVANRNPVRSALFLVTGFIMQALLYLSLSAQFIAAVQVIVYAGAIMVLFLFVIMLLNLGAPEALKEKGGLQAPAAVALSFVFLLLLAGAGALGGSLQKSSADTAFLKNGGTVEAIGNTLYNPTLPWLFPFELTSFILLVAVIGAIVLAKKRF